MSLSCRYGLCGRLFLLLIFILFHNCVFPNSANAVPEPLLLPIFSERTLMDLLAYQQLLDRTEEEAIAVARRFPDDALQHTTEGKWSPLQALEHIFLTEQLVIGLVQRPSELQHDAETVHGDSKIHHLVVNKREFKREAPERLQPAGRFSDLASFETAFHAQRQALREALQHSTIVCDKRMFPHPALGNMTVADWLYFLAHHTQRHLEQLKEQIPATV
ncbi:MAG: DinB family protein [Chitinophagaceae bacterium]|nr:MAG: DinB family protein [Chitinophagaceae bacterium]